MEISKQKVVCKPLLNVLSVVLNIEEYHFFLPFCKEISFLEKDKVRNQIQAKTAISFGPFSSIFNSDISYTFFTDDLHCDSILSSLHLIAPRIFPTQENKSKYSDLLSRAIIKITSEGEIFNEMDCRWILERVQENETKVSFLFQINFKNNFYNKVLKKILEKTASNITSIFEDNIR